MMRLVLLFGILFATEFGLAADFSCFPFWKSSGGTHQSDVLIKLPGTGPLVAYRVVPINEKVHDILSSTPESGTICLKGTVIAPPSIFMAYDALISDQKQ